MNKFINIFDFLLLFKFSNCILINLFVNIVIVLLDLFVKDFIGTG